MKKNLLLLIALFYTCFGYSQVTTPLDSLGLPGDNLNLYAVLDLFQNSKTFEEFERKLNEEDSKINNLDLNNDGKTDYIKVIDHQDGETHSIVLQIPINSTENQDIAVIEIEKDKDNNLKVQIVGNEALYGKDYIVEPQENERAQNTTETINPAARQETDLSNNNTNNGNNKTVVSVVYWPMVGYMYGPHYSVYSSPWYWNSYPNYWRPWAPWHWRHYYRQQHSYYNHYNQYYQRTIVYRNERAHGIYRPREVMSVTVQKNHAQGVYLKNSNRINHANNNSFYIPNEANRNLNKPRQYNSDRPAPRQNSNQPGNTLKTKNRRFNNSNNRVQKAPKHNRNKNRGTRSRR